MEEEEDEVENQIDLLGNLGNNSSLKHNQYDKKRNLNYKLKK